MTVAFKVNLRKRDKTYWLLQWHDDQGRRRFESIGRCVDMTKREAEDRRRAKEQAFGRGEAKVNRVHGATLGSLIAMYPDRRRKAEGSKNSRRLKGAPKLSEATITEHMMTLRYLVQHFGESRTLTKINEADAETFIDTLESGALAGARKAIKREWTIGEQAMRKHMRNCKAIFSWCVRFEYATANPFKNFDSTSLESSDKSTVPAADVQRIIEAETTPLGWKALFALCRFAGLRKGEAYGLAWSGTSTDRKGREWAVGADLDARLIRLVAEKTGMYRAVPMTPLVHSLLSRLRAESMSIGGAGTVCGLSHFNETRNAQRIIRWAGLTPWPDIFQAMRRSCENDWKEARIAEATYASWMGHSAAVSRQHYTEPTAAELAAVTGLSLVG